MSASRYKDRNFDDLAHRFRHRIYGGLKGDVRLAVLNRDLAPLLAADQRNLKVIDAGGGQGHFAMDLAEAGHQVFLADISAQMLAHADAQIREKQLQKRVSLLHRPLQELPQIEALQDADLLICHAVLEWLEQPQQALQQLRRLLKPGGHLSLTFYNRRGLEFRLLQRGSFRQLDRNIDENHWGGHPGGLTPQNPLLPESVQAWLTEADFSVVCHSGIRCFHDFMTPRFGKKCPPQRLWKRSLSIPRWTPIGS
ncbi:methyltransferase domain-containing protein [Microbulbifer sp. OS29]|uniref:Methyltransferase domain-containing protein n=1 Tax=Microbulbifer okhotskensis TaxID=2926617 RepID=A0A9X2J6W5_9GAMM|nr:methyltransferase [Microbulbifer okhotskensis]MCO1335864.1 methyltransferase domain-containing protein [Microbulbifer okhotskensis]